MASNLMTAAQFIALKKRAKAEMKRRCYNGSLSSYATNSTSDPSASNPMLSEEAHDLMDGILVAKNVANLSASDIGSGATIPSGFSNSNINSVLTSLESVSATSSASGCKSSCTGLCQGGCSTGCSGCSGCSGCGDRCSTNCNYDCYGGCSGSCSGGCTGCSGSCSGGCTGCEDECSPDCWVGCDNAYTSYHY